MKDKIILPLLIIVLASIAIGVSLFIMPVATRVYSTEMAYQTKIVARASNYPNVTTPLSQETVADICKKFEIAPEDKRCQPNTVVYGPDFFADIKLYFGEVPENEATFELVDSKLGSYLVSCGDPSNSGNYRCQYDLRGDGIYPIFVLFNDKDVYHQIIADTSGGS